MTTEEAVVDAKLVEEALAYSYCHGLLMRRGPTATHAPCSLQPCEVPHKAWEQVVQLAKPFNELVDRVARDTSFLRETLRSTAAQDEFTHNMVQLWETVLQEGIRQPVYLGVHRSDYMLHAPDCVEPHFLQVELNTIASSFGCIGSQCTGMHRFLAARGQLRDASKQEIPVDALPRNTAIEHIPQALAAAAKHVHPSAPVVLMVVLEGDTNSVDQRFLEYGLWEKHGVRTLRASLDYVHEHGSLDETTHDLLLDGHHVSVVYYRAGYVPEHYPSGAFPEGRQWASRLMMERSIAIKCPSVAYHLTGSKKVQQSLASEGVLEQFVSDKELCTKMREVFAGLWSLDEHDSSREAVHTITQRAIAHPNDFVLKPQREGGGNNFYGAELTQQLQSMDASQRKAFILMSRICPKPHHSMFMKDGELARVRALFELGIFSTFLGDGQHEPLVNQEAGHLVRSKAEGVDEGGVATGFAVLDSPRLV